MKLVQKVLTVSLVALIGAAVMTTLLSGDKISHSVSHSDSQTNADAKADMRKPLYWVAPMDPNYRRDKPGKSPMGMDLVAVYSDDAQTSDSGVISVSPTLANNLALRTATVTHGVLQSTIRAPGYVQYDEDRMVHIHSRAEGWVETLHARSTGTTIVKGQPLYALYSPQIVNAQEEFLLALRSDNTRLMEASKNRLKVFQLDDKFIQQLSRSREVQQAVTFYAPQSGILHNLDIREGFFIKPETTLMSIAATDEVWVEAQVFERQAKQVQVGLPVAITFSVQPGKIWRGVVDYIYPALDEVSHSLRVRIRLADKNAELKPNMFAQVEIESASQTHAILVPTEALIRTGKEDRVVLALGDGRFKSTTVTLGQITDRFAEVLSGLDNGDQVVTSAQFLLDSESNKRAGLRHLSPAIEEPDLATDQHQSVDHSQMTHH